MAINQPQTVILPFGQPIGFPGICTREVDSSSASNAESATNIGYGLGVKPGTHIKEALLPTTGCKLAGITVNRAVFAPGTFGSDDQTGSPPGQIPDSMMTLLTEGRIWVQVDADSTPTNGAGAWMRFETDGASNTLRGTFREGDDGHSVDVTKAVTFKSGKYLSVDQLTGGTTYIAEVYVSVSNKL